MQTPSGTRSLTSTVAIAAALALGIAMLGVLRLATRSNAVAVPEGWVTLTSGELAVSVPPDWEVDVRTGSSRTGVVNGGPCSYDLVPGVLTQDSGRSPAVVYRGPSGGVCLPIGHPPADRPGLVLYETRTGDVEGEAGQPGAELNDIDRRAVRERLGAVEVWREVWPPDPGDDEAMAAVVVGYVAAELIGGLWVAHPDDPVMADVLATLRPADDAVASERHVTRAHREVAGWETRAVLDAPGQISGGAVVRDADDLTALWDRLRREDDPPEPADGRAFLVATTYAGGLPGGCHRRSEVVEVRIQGSWATLVLGDPVEEACSDRPYAHLVSVPDDEVAGLDGVGAVPAADLVAARDQG